MLRDATVSAKVSQLGDLVTTLQQAAARGDRIETVDITIAGSPIHLKDVYISGFQMSKGDGRRRRSRSTSARSTMATTSRRANPTARRGALDGARPRASTLASMSLAPRTWWAWRSERGGSLRA